jgi:D-glycero-D-manno-heptose 1,7-bisphosphate phosphatase
MSFNFKLEKPSLSKYNYIVGEKQYWRKNKMGRFSVEANMVPIDDQINISTTLELTFPDQFTKFMIALDRDGVLCECKDVINNVKDFEVIPNSLRAVAILRSVGHKITILFDQPGISRKKITIPEVEAMNQHLLKLLGQAGCISIDGIFYNTSDKKRDVYAKPNIGMFTHAKSLIPGIKIQDSLYVGDHINDMIMAHNAGVTPILVLTGHGRKTQEILEKPIYKLIKPKVKIFSDLMAFAQSLS